jgi:hypothetical protein
MEFYFPAAFLLPKFDEEEITHGGFRVIRRRWGVSTFDWATLATKHKLHFPYQVGDVLLGSCNCEFVVAAKDQHAARAEIELLRLGLYLTGRSPFVCPFVSDYSINSYSAINDRESTYHRERLTDERREGPTSPHQIVTMWPVHLTFTCIAIAGSRDVNASDFCAAADTANSFREVIKSSPQAQSYMQALNSAATILPIEQSCLHIWTGLESLFPDVNAELSFRLSILLAQLAENGPSRRAFYERVKRAYSIRSKIAHGSCTDMESAAWTECWNIAIKVGQGILARGVVPKEAALLADLFD